MLSFLRFIARHTAYLLFLFYCGISILLIQLQRKETLDAIRAKGMEINAFIAEQFSGFSSLLTLRQDNDRLLLQNARLFSRLIQIQPALQDAKVLAALNSRNPERYGNFLVARIVDRRFSSKENMLVINAGSLQGISKDMTVLTPDGLVGRIIFVTDNYSRVLPVINANFKASVISDSTNTLGILTWDGGDEHIAHFDHVPISSNLQKGELLSTSDYSTFALRGIPVGRIAKITKDKLFCNIDVHLAVDFSSLSHVLVSRAKPPMEKLGIIENKE